MCVNIGCGQSHSEGSEGKGKAHCAEHHQPLVSTLLAVSLYTLPLTNLGVVLSRSFSQLGNALDVPSDPCMVRSRREYQREARREQQADSMVIYTQNLVVRIHH